MRYKKYFLAIILLAISCSENISNPEDEDPFRYHYPDYSDGGITFLHSFYHSCEDNEEDREYWSEVYRSKQFVVYDSLFFIMREGWGRMHEIPNLTSEEEATLICSNGDHEKVIFDLPHPKCLQQIPEMIRLFGGIPSTKQAVNNYNGYIDIQQDTIVVIAHYKSYWTGNIVNDTAYVSP